MSLRRTNVLPLQKPVNVDAERRKAARDYAAARQAIANQLYEVRADMRRMVQLQEKQLGNFENAKELARIVGELIVLERKIP